MQEITVNTSLTAETARIMIEVVKEDVLPNRKLKAAYDKLLSIVSVDYLPTILTQQIYKVPDTIVPLNSVIDELMETIAGYIQLNSIQKQIGEKGLGRLKELARVRELNIRGMKSIFKQLKAEKDPNAVSSIVRPVLRKAFKAEVDRMILDTKVLRSFFAAVIIRFANECPLILTTRDIPAKNFKHKDTSGVVRLANDKMLDEYMKKEPVTLGNFSLDMAVEPESITYRSVTEVGQMSFTLNPNFNRIMRQLIANREYFKELVANGSKDAEKVEQRTVSAIHAINDGQRLWLRSNCQPFFTESSLDFRGRISQLGGLSSVAGKAAKSMLRAGEKRPLGSTGLKWMLMGLASAMGHDKASWAERLRIGGDLQERIAIIGGLLLRDGVSGMKILMGLKPDNCFKAAAFAIEFSELDRWIRGGGTAETFETDILIGIDGTCSGLQHMSMLLRNVELATATNVYSTTTEGTVMDVYAALSREMTLAAQDSLNRLDDEQTKTMDLYLSLSDKEKRAISKPLLMKEVYGAMFLTHKESVEDVLVEKGIVDRKDKNVKVHGKYLAQLFAVTCKEGSAFKAVFEFKEFAKGIAKAFTDADMHVQYDIPIEMDGGPRQRVTFNYQKDVGERYFLMDNGKKKCLRSYGLDSLLFDPKDVKEIDKAKECSAMPPNFIHSLDATFLHMVVVRMTSQCTMGLTHDCLYTTPDEMDRMSAIIRDTWKEMYYNQGSILEDLQRQTFEATGVMVDLPPSLGNKEVLADGFEKAIYSFC